MYIHSSAKVPVTGSGWPHPSAYKYCKTKYSPSCGFGLPTYMWQMH